jgi:hypothetical protein
MKKFKIALIVLLALALPSLSLAFPPIMGGGAGGSMTWPTGSAGVPYYAGGSAWGTSVAPCNNGILGFNSAGVFGCYTAISFDDSAAQVYNAAAPTKKGRFNASAITAGQTRVFNWPDADLSFGTGVPAALANAPNTSGGLTTPDGSATLTNKSITALEVDGSAATNLTAAQVSGTVIYNTGQADADVYLTLPPAAAGYQFLATVGTARAKYWRVKAGANDKIYLVAADGTVAGGSDAGYVGFVNAQIGQSFACWSFKTDAYDWQCKAISIGTSTFVATAP